MEDKNKQGRNSSDDDNYNDSEGKREDATEKGNNAKNAVYTNGSAAQQQIERDKKPGEDEDVFDNGLNVPLTDTTASWNEDEEDNRVD